MRVGGVRVAVAFNTTLPKIRGAQTPSKHPTNHKHTASVLSKSRLKLGSKVFLPIAGPKTRVVKLPRPADRVVATDASGAHTGTCHRTPELQTSLRRLPPAQQPS